MSPGLGRITGATRLVGIIGHPVAHSCSPAMHNAAFAELGMDWAYVPFDVTPEALPQAVKGIAALGLAGLNVTIPHKETILPLLDNLTPEATAIGAVNTVICQPDGTLLGHNTDGEGFSRALHEAHRFLPQRSLAFVMGAGGSARAVCDQLAREGVRGIRIASRTLSKAEALADHITKTHPSCDAKAVPWGPLEQRAAINWAELIVNTTPVGMKAGDPSPLDVNGISPGHIVVDLIYAPPVTPLLAQCQELRARYLNGMGMLLHQGAAAFSRWTGEDAPLETMRKTLESNTN